MKSRLRPLAYLLAVIFLFPSAAIAFELSSSVWTGIGKGAHGDNGTLILGVNTKNGTLSGYYESSDRSANIDAECKFFFTGQAKDQSVVPINIVGVHPDSLREQSDPVRGRIEHQPEQQTITIYLHKIPSSCDWLYHGLPSYVPPRTFTLESGLSSEFRRNGAWHAVTVIRAKKSHFHSQPSDANRGGAYLVTGDLIYIYDETPNWYYVEYRGEKKVTRGWMKKIDTMQIVNPR